MAGEISKKTLDMTQGSIMKSVILFALPICIGNILQTFYSTCDTMILGRYCSASSIAAVGTSANPIEFLLCFAMGIGSGVNIIVSQFRGSKNMEGMKSAIKAAIFITYAIGLIVMILGQFFGPVLLRIMHVPSDAWDFAVSYVRVIFFVSLANLGYNMNAGILRGLGDSKAGLIFLFISCIVNIILDLVFVAKFHLDVFGAALATAIAMSFSWIFSIFYIKFRFPEVEFTFLPKKAEKLMLKKIISVGLPLGLNSSIYSIGHIALSTLGNLQGSTYVAGCAVASRVTGMSNMVISAFGASASAFSGQNFGARKFDRLKEGSWKIPLFNGAFTLTCGLIMVFFFGASLASCFTKDPNVLFYAVRYIRIVLPFSWCYAVLSTIIAYTNGAGVIGYPTVINILMLWAVRIPTGIIINTFFDGTYIMIAFPVSFAFGMIFMVAFLFTKKWKTVVSGASVS